MIPTANRLQTVQEYYFSRKLREVRELIAQGKPIINMGIGSPDLTPDPEVIKTLQHVMNDPGAHQYQSYQGLPQLREAIADFYATKFSVSLDPTTEILPLMGSKEGIMHISMAFLNAGDEVLVPNPGYPTYTSVTKLVEAIPRFYNLKEEKSWLPNIKALEKEDLSKVKLMWVSYPHMPTGAVASQEELQQLVDFGKRHKILIVNDNPYSFVLNQKPKSILNCKGAKTVALELNSLSKTYNMAGWRVGMVLGSGANITAILKVKSNMDSGMFYGIQKGAITALQSTDLWYNQLNAIYAERKTLVLKLANQLGCSYDNTAVGMFVWAKLPEKVLSSEAYIDSLLYEKNIFVTPGSIFGANGEGYIRFSLCVAKERIIEAINRL